MVKTFHLKNDQKWGKGGGKQVVMVPMMVSGDGTMVPVSGGGGWGSPMGKGGKGGKGGGKKWAYHWDKSGGELGEYTGTIKSGGAKYSFIECEEAGQGDIFLHWEERKAYKTGQTVKFTLILNKDGKPNAIKLKSGLKGGDQENSWKPKSGNAVKSKSGKEFTGTIKSGGKSYGFIECPQASKGDIFLSSQERKGYKTGQTVKFTLVFNEDGKPNATNLKSGLK